MRHFSTLRSRHRPLRLGHVQIGLGGLHSGLQFQHGIVGHELFLAQRQRLP
ncbi:MAG: hypothetical protein V9G98_00710 [Candidatus Competibacter sp.]